MVRGRWLPESEIYVDALKFSPPAPTMLDMRDAMLLSDALRNPAGAYLPPSAVLPPAEALPLPTAKAATDGKGGR